MINLKGMMKLSNNIHKAFEKQKEKLVKFQKSVLWYLLFNVFLVFPIFCLNEKYFFCMPKLYIILMIYYYVFKLTYFHIGVSILFSIYNMIFLKSNVKNSFFSLIIIILDIILNVYWLKNGEIWTIQ